MKDHPNTPAHIKRRMPPDDGPLSVEVFLQTALIRGYSANVSGRRRLVDLLNGSGEDLELSNVSLEILPLGRSIALPTMAIRKHGIVAAIPHETREQDHSRQVSNLGGRTKTRQTPVVILTPPYTIEGTAHLASGSSLPKVITASPSLFTPFFSVTDATITSAESAVTNADVVLVNRSLIVAISSTAEGDK